MANVFKKISNFQATIEVGGRDVEAEFDSEGLTLKVDPDQALAILAHLAKLRGDRAERRVRAPRTPRPASPPDPPSQGSNPPTVESGRTSAKDPAPARAPRKGAERTTPTPPLETPDELRAAREARAARPAESEAAPSVSKPAAAEQPAKPDAAAAVAEKQAKAFVEDLAAHQAADAAKMVADGSAAVPAALLDDKANVRRIIATLMDLFKLETAGDVLEACTAWRPHLPKLRDLPDASFKSRVANAFEIEMADRASNPDHGAA